MNSTLDARSYLQSYHDQIEALERAAKINDPAGARAYDAALEQQFDAVKAQVLGPGHDACHHYGGASTDASAGPNTFARNTAQSSSSDNAAAPGGYSVSGGGAQSLNLPAGVRPYAAMIDAASRATGVPAVIIAAQIMQESGGDKFANSTNPGNGKTDVGLLQVNPDTFADLQRKHPELQGGSLSDPATNISAGAYLMSDLLNQYNGNVDDALRAYNSGSVDLSDPNIAPGGIGDPNYVRSVNAIISSMETG